MTDDSASSTLQATPSRLSTRLYISPLAPSLLSTILPQNLQSAASDISYHALQTFPEKNYGYATLSTSDAQRLKAKLNGSILRGVKMRVEEARPDTRRRRKASDEGISEDANVVGHTDAKEQEQMHSQARRERRRHRRTKDGNENGVLEAVELPEGRSVKRGWSQPDGGKDTRANRDKRNKKDSGKGEMLFRTNLPPNVASNVAPSHEDIKSLQKSKKEKKASKPGKAIEVTEFDKSTKYPSFLRDAPVSAEEQRASEFIEGTGWVDEDGNVVEPIKRRPKRRDHIQSTSSEAENAAPPAGSHESQSENGASEDQIGNRSTSPAAMAQPKPIHPLEALFKRPLPRSKSDADSAKSSGAPRPAPIKTSFSFFPEDRDDDDDDYDESRDAVADEFASMAPPQTPFTRQDMEMRGVRSAAPTPDTAALGRRFSMPWRRGTTDSGELNGEGAPGGNDEEHEDDDKEGDDNDNDTDNDDDDTAMEIDGANVDDASKAAETNTPDDGDGQNNDFEKHFWQHRADYNRAWRTRKREARKELRKSENRKRGGIARR